MLNFVCQDAYTLDDFVRLISFLRSENGCPWDRVQTHESIRRNFLEEAYEACEAIDEHDLVHMREELGDVLMQVLFHADIEREAGHFTIQDVADAACKKLVSRHPHVFGERVEKDSDAVLSDWEAIKRQERAQTTTAEAMQTVSRYLPALWRCEKVQSKAAKPALTGRTRRRHCPRSRRRRRSCAAPWSSKTPTPSRRSLAICCLRS